MWLHHINPIRVWPLHIVPCLASVVALAVRVLFCKGKLLFFILRAWRRERRKAGETRQGVYDSDKEPCDIQAKLISHKTHCSRRRDYSVQLCRFPISSLKQMFLCVENAKGLETQEYKLADPLGELPGAPSPVFHIPRSRRILWEGGRVLFPFHR